MPAALATPVTVPGSDPAIASAQLAATVGKTMAGPSRIINTRIGTVTRRFATVLAVNTGELPVTVDIMLGGVKTDAVVALAHYSPNVGDSVAVDLVSTAGGYDPLVVGATLTYANTATSGSAPNTGTTLAPTAGEDGTASGGGGTSGALNISASFSTPTADHTIPDLVTVTLTPGSKMIIASWSSALTGAGNDVASYTCQIALDQAFTNNVITQVVTGPVVSFTNLTGATTYWVQVAARSYAGLLGSWSNPESAETVPLISADLGIASVTADQLAEDSVTAVALANGAVGAANIQAGAIGAVAIAANSITANQLAAGTITAAEIGANSITAAEMVTGTITAASGIIASLSASVLTTGTIAAQTITLGANSRGDVSAIQSASFTAGSVGWAIRSDGTAFFANAQITNTEIVGGVISAASLLLGSNTNLGGYTGATNAISFDDVAAIYSSDIGQMYLSATTLNFYAPSVFEGNMTVNGTLEVTGLSTLVGGVTTTNNIHVGATLTGAGPGGQPILNGTHSGVAHAIYFHFDTSTNTLFVNVDSGSSSFAIATT